jgi:hypothetical protein
VAVYPGAVRKLIAPSDKDPRITPKVAVLHVDAGNATSLYNWFKQQGTTESHFHIRKDGVVEQYRDTDWQADAQVGGASHGISIETQGYGTGSWTPEQVAAIKSLLTWLHKTHPIPLRPPANPYDAGVGYHSMWPSSREGTWARDGRTCPGPDRIKQYRNVLVPWMSNAKPAPATQEDDDMPTAEEIAKAVWAHPVPRLNNTPAPAGSQLGNANVYSYRAARGVVDVAKVAAAVIAALPAGSADVDVDALAKAIVVELGKD